MAPFMAAAASAVQTASSTQNNASWASNVKTASTIVEGAGFTADALHYYGPKVGSNGRFYFNKYAGGNGSYRTLARLKTVGRVAGNVLAPVGLVFDWYQVFGTHTESFYLATANSAMVGVGVLGGPPGEAAAAIYFAGEFAIGLYKCD